MKKNKTISAIAASLSGAALLISASCPLAFAEEVENVPASIEVMDAPEDTDAIEPVEAVETDETAADIDAIDDDAANEENAGEEVISEGETPAGDDESNDELAVAVPTAPASFSAATEDETEGDTGISLLSLDTRKLVSYAEVNSNLYPVKYFSSDKEIDLEDGKSYKVSDLYDSSCIPEGYHFVSARVYVYDNDGKAITENDQAPFDFEFVAGPSTNISFYVSAEDDIRFPSDISEATTEMTIHYVDAYNRPIAPDETRTVSFAEYGNMKSASSWATFDYEKLADESVDGLTYKGAQALDTDQDRVVYYNPDTGTTVKIPAWEEVVFVYDGSNLKAPEGMDMVEIPVVYRAIKYEYTNKGLLATASNEVVKTTTKSFPADKWITERDLYESGTFEYPFQIGIEHGNSTGYVKGFFGKNMVLAKDGVNATANGVVEFAAAAIPLNIRISAVDENGKEIAPSHSFTCWRADIRYFGVDDPYLADRINEVLASIEPMDNKTFSHARVASSMSKGTEVIELVFTDEPKPEEEPAPEPEDETPAPEPTPEPKEETPTPAPEPEPTPEPAPEPDTKVIPQTGDDSSPAAVALAAIGAALIAAGSAIRRREQ